MSSPDFPRAAPAAPDFSAYSSAPADGSGLPTLDELYQQQLRGAAAEVAAAVAHAVGTPLNVISGRAELIRQDPSNALTQITRIEEQVRKMADGLRDFVEYLASDTRPNADLPAAQILARACALLRPVAEEQQVELLVDDSALGGVSIDQRSLANLVTLLSWAIRSTAASHPPGQRKLPLVGSASNGGAVFELQLFGLSLPQHWRIERFEASTPSAESEAFRVVAICAAIARGQGGKLQADALPGDAAAPPGSTLSGGALPGGATPNAGSDVASSSTPGASPAGAGVHLRLLCRAST